MKSNNLTLKTLSRIILKNIIVIAIFAIIGGLSFFALAKHKESTLYTADRDIMIRSNLNSDKSYSRIKTELDMIPTYRDMITSRQVMLSAINLLPDELQKKTDVDDINKVISINSHPDSLVMSIKATSGSESDSIAYVNSVAKAAKKELPKIQPGIGDIYLYPSANSKNVIEEDHSSVKKYTLVGIALGIIIGMVIAFTRTSLKEFN